MSYLKELIKRSQKKNIRLFYHLSSLHDITKPRFIKKLERKAVLSAYKRLSWDQKREIYSRVKFYNKLSANSHFNPNNREEAIYKVSDLKIHAKFNGRRSHSTYCYDSLKYLRCYNQRLNSCFVFGDVSWVPQQPSFVKSRPIDENNSNSVLLALNHIRHFNFIHDSVEYCDKLDMLIGISYAKQQNRQRFLKSYFGHPLCRLGSAHKLKGELSIYNVEHVSINEQLRYKFILCLEGNDVATNLKWVMSSNSIAVMPKPKFETWFMESRLQGGVHYIEIDDDYSNLEQKLQYYIEHPAEAQKIIDAAHKYIDQFRNKKIEKIISMRVVENYFKCTNQI